MANEIGVVGVRLALARSRRAWRVAAQCNQLGLRSSVRPLAFGDLLVKSRIAVVGRIESNQVDSICARFGVRRQRVDVLVRSSAPNDHERCLLLFAGEETLLGPAPRLVPTRSSLHPSTGGAKCAEEPSSEPLARVAGSHLGPAMARAPPARWPDRSPDLRPPGECLPDLPYLFALPPPLLPLAFAVFLISGAVAFATALKREWKSFASHVLLIFASPSSSAELQALFASRTSSFIRLSNRARNGNGLTKMSSTAALIGWSAVSLLQTVAAVYPAALVRRLVRSRRAETRKRLLLVSHESQLNGAPRSLLTMIQHTDRREFEPILLVPSEGQLTLEGTCSRSRCLCPPNLAAPGPRPTQHRGATAAIPDLVAVPTHAAHESEDRSRTHQRPRDSRRRDCSLFGSECCTSGTFGSFSVPVYGRGSRYFCPSGFQLA